MMIERPCVLVVDDEPDLRDILGRILKSQNIQFDLAENGLIALEKLRTEKYHTVLCDIMMPEMTGLQCLAQAKVEGLLAPFVFLTGYADHQRMLQAIRLGAVDFLTKPFENSGVVDVVFRALDMGIRQVEIMNEIKILDSDLLMRIKRNEKMISLMRANNNIKRIA